jgi:hypothetical protein
MCRRIVSKLPHVCRERGYLVRLGEQVHQGAVGGEADRLLLVRRRPLHCGPPRLRAEPGADRLPVVGRPRIVRAGMDDGKRPRATIGGPGGSPEWLAGSLRSSASTTESAAAGPAVWSRKRPRLARTSRRSRREKCGFMRLPWLASAMGESVSSLVECDLTSAPRAANPRENRKSLDGRLARGHAGLGVLSCRKIRLCGRPADYAGLFLYWLPGGDGPLIPVSPDARIGCRPGTLASRQPTHALPVPEAEPCLRLLRRIRPPTTPRRDSARARRSAIATTCSVSTW